MIHEYSIFSGKEVIGSARITQEGLYYKICCRCELTGEVIYKVVITGDDIQEDLGVCVPMDGRFGVCTRIPAKRIAGKEIHFCAVPRHKKAAQKAVTVLEGSPFDYIARLEEAFLVKIDGRAAIAFSDENG